VQRENHVYECVERRGASAPVQNMDSLSSGELASRDEPESLDRKAARVVVSGYAASHPRALTAVGDFLFWEPAHWIMQTRQLTNLGRRVER
jgi:hypothetical protein